MQLLSESLLIWFCFYFPGQGQTEAKEKNRGLCGSVNGCLTKEELYGNYTTLLNELNTEDEKAFNYTRLIRDLNDEVMKGRRYSRVGRVV